MNNDVRSTVAQYPTLRLQINKGDLHRIMRSGMGRGSLWIAPRTNGYCVCPTGEVETLLYNFLSSHFGTETRVNQGKKYWDIENDGDVAKVIQHFGES